jgi:hypothetical protein
MKTTKYQDIEDIYKFTGICEWDNGERCWLVDGMTHRLDGPAVQWADGSKQWWIENKEYTEEEFNQHPLVIQHKRRLSVETED